MAATVTLSSTTLSTALGESDQQIKVASTSGLVPGIRLFIDKELLEVVSLGVSPWVNVLRGRDGTPASAHDPGTTVWVGRGDQFFSSDPVGAPLAAVLVSPHINVITGGVWFAQGDASPEAIARRWWQLQTTTYGIGALGVRTTSLEPTSST